MSSELSQRYGVTPGKTFGSSGNVDVNCKGATGVLVHILTVTGGGNPTTFTSRVSVDGDNFTTQRTVNAKTGAETAAGSTITPAANDLYYIPTYGASKCRIAGGGDDGTLSAVPVFAGEALMDQAVTATLGSEKTDDNPFTPGTSTVVPIGAMADETTPDSVDEGDVGIPRMTLDRKLHTASEREVGTIRYNGTSYTLVEVNIDTATSGNNALVAADASNKIAVVSYDLYATSTNAIYFNDGTANLMGGTRKLNLDATGATGAAGVAKDGGDKVLFRTAAVNRPLNLNLGSANGIAGTLIYFKHP